MQATRALVERSTLSERSQPGPASISWHPAAYNGRLSPDERKALQAAAMAHLRTGLPIITHSLDGCAQCALDQVNILETAGANLHQVDIGHLNDIEDQPTVAPIAIAKRGAYLGLDHSGRP